MSRKARKLKKEQKKQKAAANKKVVKRPSAKTTTKRKEQVVAVTEGAVPARVMEFVGSMGTREGGKQVRVKILDGYDAGKVIRRNVLGPIKINDIIMLRETEIEASPLKGRKR